MKRRLILAALAALTALGACGGAPAFAQFDESSSRSLPLMADYDLDSTSYQFCSSTGLLGQVRGGNNISRLKVKTSGSSTSVTANTAGQNPFANIAVGDILTFPVSGVSPAGTTDSTIGREVSVYVSARADADNVTVNTALDLSAGYVFTWRKVTCAATGGWVPVRNAQTVEILFQIDQLNVVGGIDYKVECRNLPTGPVALVFQQAGANLTATGAVKVMVPDPFDECRLGFKIGSADDGSGDAGANIEKISAAFTWVQR